MARHTHQTFKLFYFECVHFFGERKLILLTGTLANGNPTRFLQMNAKIIWSFQYNKTKRGRCYSSCQFWLLCKNDFLCAKSQIRHLSFIQNAGNIAGRCCATHRWSSHETSKKKKVANQSFSVLYVVPLLLSIVFLMKLDGLMSFIIMGNHFKVYSRSSFWHDDF